MAIAQTKLKNNDKAMAAVSKSINFNPKYTKAYVKRGELHEENNEFDEAVRDYAKA